MEEADYMEVRDINLKDKEEKEKRLKETKIKIEKFKNDKEADPTYQELKEAIEKFTKDL